MALAPSRYELLDRIAVGGMAEVFRAKAYGAHGFEKTLAIKKILPELAKDPEFEDRFIAEAKLAVELSHANIVQVLDFGRFAGTLFIAMELVNGLDLAALLKFYTEKGTLVPIPAAFQISLELIRGLSFAHQNGVVHRDISPSNILLSRAGEVKIADFGIAMALREDLSSEEGRIMGKWRYMSPEQTRGANVSETSDLFSAAAVIYEVFAGHKLFSGETSKEIIESIHCMPIPKISELRPGVPEVLDEILAGALEREVGKRSARGVDLLRSLTEASYKSSIVATSVDVADSVVAALDAGVAGTTAQAPEGMDALIRAQLLEASREQGGARRERRTAVAGEENSQSAALAGTEVAGRSGSASMGDGGTMVRGVVDADGVTNWRLDEETVAAIPSAKRGAQADLSSGETTPSIRERESSRGRYEPDYEGHAGLRRGVIIAGFAFTTFVIITVIFAVRGGKGRDGEGGQTSSAVSPSVQAHREEATTLAGANPSDSPVTELLIIDSEPPGASVFVEGRLLGALTPTETLVAVNKPVEIRMELAGYESYQSTKTLRAGRALDLRHMLVPFKSTLIVTTVPRGVTVYLDGEKLGLTPLSVATLSPGEGRKLSLELKNYLRVDRVISLRRDAPTTVRESLRSTIVYGTINIDTGKNWARVREGGKVLGETPGTFKLSVGKHRLLFSNPLTGKSMSKTVEVFEKRVKTYHLGW